MAKHARTQKRKRRGLLLGVLALVVVAIAGLSVLLRDDEKKPVTVADLVVTDLEVGTGDAAKAGDTLAVHYVGTLLDGGTEFDSNQDPDEPLTFVLGDGRVIAGWEQGLVGVQAGGTRQLDIPAELAYGDQGSGTIIKPGDSLRFVIEVVSITPPEPTPCPEADGSSTPQTSFDQAPPMCIDVTKTYTATVVTNMGEFTIALDPAKAPLTVNNFVVLSRYHFFDGLTCHRVTFNHVAQCGDPNGDGSGGPGYEFDDELPVAGEYKIGSVAMANSGVNTNGSQWFVVTGTDGVALPPDYSLFGQVTDGLDTTIVAIAALADPTGASQAPTTPVIIESITISET